MDTRLPRIRPPATADPLPKWSRKGPSKPAGLPAEVVDRLSALTDRDDLARLFERNVDLPTIVRLAGRQIPREKIRALLDSADPAREARRLLD